MRFLQTAGIRILLLLLPALSLPGQTPDPDFHLYLLVGQSNMAGRGKVEAQDREVHPRVLAFGKEDRWIPATDPLHFDKPIAGVGLGVTFGRTMADADPRVRIGLIPNAYGGTSITAWQKDADPHERFGPMYAETVRRARQAMKSGVLRGILWHQGESDMTRPGQYQELLLRFFADLRRDLGAEQIPIVVGLLGRWREEDPKQADGARAINTILRGLPVRLKHCAVADSAGLTNKPDDPGHFNAASYREFGRRYAARMQALRQESR
jgi:hypothetical protein